MTPKIECPTEVNLENFKYAYLDDNALNFMDSCIQNLGYQPQPYKQFVKSIEI